jgi:hypothetical protein
MNGWYDPTICLPFSGDTVEVLGNPTYCCDEDSEEEGIYHCLFVREISEWSPDMKHYTFSEIFEVCEPPLGRYMINAKKWRPLQRNNP